MHSANEHFLRLPYVPVMIARSLIASSLLLLSPVKALGHQTATITPAAACRVSIDLAQLVAVGTTHGYGEYLIQFSAAPASDTGPFTIRFSAGDSAGTTTTLSVDGIGPGGLWEDTIPRDALVVLPAPDIRWFEIETDSTQMGDETCGAATRYVMTKFFSTREAFDDTAAWVKVGSPVRVVPLSATLANGSQPKYPDLLKEEGVQGDVVVSVLVGPDGRPKDVRVTTSSGNKDLDGVAMDAAGRSAFAPKHLPAAFGGSPVAGFYEITYTFEVDQ